MAFDATMKSALERLKQGPVHVEFDYDGTPVVLPMAEGAEVTFSPGQEEAETDVVGVYDIYTTGDGLTVSMNIDEVSRTVVDRLFPQMASGTGYRGFGVSAGVSMRGHATSLRIRPWQTRTSADEQLEVWQVVPEGDITFSMTKASPWRFTATFRALPDLTKADGELLARLTSKARS